MIVMLSQYQLCYFFKDLKKIVFKMLIIYFELF